MVSWKRQLALAIVLTLVGGLVFWLEFEHLPEKEKSEEEAKKIFQISDQQIKAYSLIDNNKEIKFQCKDIDKLCKAGDQSNWQIVTPPHYKADRANVNRLITSIKNLNPAQTLDLTEDSPEKRASLLKQYGLDEERRKIKNARRVEIEMKDGSKVIAYFGRPHPVGNRIYVGVERNQNFDSNKIYLASSSFRANFEKNLGYWRDKSITSIPSHEIQALELKGSKGYFKVTRTGAKNATQAPWMIKDLRTGKTTSGDNEEVNSFLNSLAYLKGKDFAAQDKKDETAKKILRTAKKKVQLTIFSTQKVKDGDKEKQTQKKVLLTFFEKKTKNPKGSSSNKLYVTSSELPALYELQNYFLSRFDKAASDLRQTKLISSTERLGAKEIHLEGSKWTKKGPLVLKKQNGNWSFSDASEGTLDKTKVNQLLDRLSGKSIKEFLGQKRKKAERIQLSIGAPNDQDRKTFEFWKDGKNLFAKELGEKGEVLKVDKSLTEALPWQRNFFNQAETSKPAQESESKTSSES